MTNPKTKPKKTKQPIDSKDATHRNIKPLKREDARIRARIVKLQEENKELKKQAKKVKLCAEFIAKQFGEK